MSIFGAIDATKVGPNVKVYRRHNCNAKHRTFNVWLRCVLKKANWIAGKRDGSARYALLAWCGSGPYPIYLTVTLWTDGYEAVERAKHLICGGKCTGNHEVVYLDWNGQ